jgi:hypothetical protein
MFSSKRNNQVIDHDQQDAFHCTMAYTRMAGAPAVPDFCGVCNLALRFYDRVELQKAANHGNQIMATDAPVSIARATLAGSNWTLREPPLNGGNRDLGNLNVGSSIDLVAVSKEHPGLAGNPSIGRVNLTISNSNPGGELWTQSGAGRVTLAPTGAGGGRPHDRIRITGQTAGQVTLTFSRSGLTATAVVTVV